jgi:hypothetical protein
MHEIQVNSKPYEEIKIGDSVFKLDISDAAFSRYQTEFKNLADTLKNNASMDGIKKAIQTIVNSIFYDTPYDKFSSECGHRLMEMIKALYQVAKVFTDLLVVK